jgi:hypothetical protein
MPRFATPPDGFNTSGFGKRLLPTGKPMPITSASDSSEEPGHHAHYVHHEHFQQSTGLPHYKDLPKDFDKLEGKSCKKFILI